MSINMIRKTSATNGWRGTAVALAVTVPAAIVLLVVYYTVGGPFGTLNDLANALVAVLSAVLAAQTAARFRVPVAAVATAGAGATLMVVGSWLVITGRTGWVLAGLVSAAGAASLGAWLVTVNLTANRAKELSRPVARLGAASGTLMMLGILTVPDILARVDTWEGLHWHGIAGFVGWLGLYLGYPVWCALLARDAGQRRTG
ncbi:MAG TPA: hypothetical protein VI110_10680 [Lapillicoccus sp.]